LKQISSRIAALSQGGSLGAASQGALLMICASLAFAASNTLQSVLPWRYGMSSTGMAFWQYLIASVLMAPIVMRIGLNRFRTRRPLIHEIRAFASALGVHVFVYGFAAGAPIWQMVTLLATGPLFVIIGSTLFLGERASGARLGAALAGFVGAVVVSGVGSEHLDWRALTPIAAAALWAATDVLTKYLARDETPETLTVSLLVLIAPNHLAILLVVNALAFMMPPGVANGLPFALPQGQGLILLLALGAVTAAAQYLLASAYKAADAVYLQPFADLKAPLAGLIGWVTLGQTPSVWFWPGAALIVGASLFLFWGENRAAAQARIAASQPCP